jgi:hypothetical protein|tara:strand:+ start:75 stop:548 length:474 start_codon:yes stop_codon:yes gene_type:complete
MKRITAEEAEQYVPYKSDQKAEISDIAYFTRTPQEGQNQWDDVTYYLPRRKNMYAGRKGDGDSWVYVISNESQPGMYKIGYTNNDDVDVRVKQLSRSTSVATPFKLEWAFRCFNGERLEGEVHIALKAYRVSMDREFFAISINEAREVIEDLGQKYV